MKTRLLLLLVLACTCGSALGDDTAVYGVGGAMRPMEEHPSIVMEKMLVSIDLYSDRALVDCLFEFRNTGPATTVRMGFPERGNRVPKEGQPTGFTSFATWVDGKPVSTSIEGFRVEGGSVSWRRWRVKQVDFGEGQTRTVRVLYESQLTEVSDGSRYLEYEVHTGASWKGPIGFCRGLLHLHYDPGRERFEVSQPFRRVGLNSFEWVQHNFDPPAGYDIRINYFPWFGELIVNGVNRWLAETGAPYPYIEDGHIWAQVHGLARWIEAQVFTQASHVVLIRGGRVVTLWRESPWMEYDGQRVRLPAPTRMEGGRLMVPLAAVARALGAEVVFDAQTRGLRITLPLYRHLAAALGPENAGAALRALPPGWAPPETSEFDPEVVRYARRRGGIVPWLAAGDFNGDGHREVALLLCNGTRMGVGVLERWGGPRFGLIWLESWQRYEGESLVEVRPGLRGLKRMICTRKPGIVPYLEEVEEETDETPGRLEMSGRLDLKHDGIEVGYKHAELHYWDAGSHCYRSVTTAD